MALSPAQFKKMEYLLGKSKHEPLTREEEKELRNYVVMEQPEAAGVSFETIVSIGLIIVGAYLIYKLLESA